MKGQYKNAFLNSKLNQLELLITILTLKYSYIAQYKFIMIIYSLVNIATKSGNLTINPFSVENTSGS